MKSESREMQPKPPTPTVRVGNTDQSDADSSTKATTKRPLPDNYICVDPDAPLDAAHLGICLRCREGLPDPDAGTGWLLERAGKHGPQWITASGGLLNWTSDPNLALRLCRRADADQLAEIVDDCDRVTEHQWGDIPVDKARQLSDAVVDAAINWARVEGGESLHECDTLSDRVEELLSYRTDPPTQPTASASALVTTSPDERVLQPETKSSSAVEARARECADDETKSLGSVEEKNLVDEG